MSEYAERFAENDIDMRRWSRAKTGEGQAVLLSGGSGDRQIAAYGGTARNHRQRAHTRLRYFCSPQHTDSAFYPIDRPDRTCRWV